MFIPSGAYPGDRPPGRPSESLILVPSRKLEEHQFGVPEVSLLEPCLRLNCRGRSRIFIIREDTQIKDSQNLWGSYRGVSEGDVPPQKWRKNWFLKPICAIWCILFAYGTHTIKGAQSLQRIGKGRIPHLNGTLFVMLIYLSFPFLSPSFLSSHSFPLFLFSLFSLSYFGAPLVTLGPWGPRPPKPPRIRPCTLATKSYKGTFGSVSFAL